MESLNNNLYNNFHLNLFMRNSAISSVKFATQVWRFILKFFLETDKGEIIHWLKQIEVLNFLESREHVHIKERDSSYWFLCLRVIPKNRSFIQSWNYCISNNWTYLIFEKFYSLKVIKLKGSTKANSKKPNNIAKNNKKGN